MIYMLYEVAGKYREGSTSLEASTLRAENKTTLLSQDMDSMAEGPEDGDQAGAIYLESCFKVTDIAHRQEMEALSVRPLAPTLSMRVFMSMFLSYLCPVRTIMAALPRCDG